MAQVRPIIRTISPVERACRRIDNLAKGRAMPLTYESINADVRRCMLDELAIDVANHTLYVSPRLIDGASTQWEGLLREAVATHDDAWLATETRRRGLIRAQEQRRTKNGGTSTVAVPHTAADTLADGEFNRLYARGLCAHVLATGGHEVEVYRGRDSANPRPSSEELIGRRFPAKALLDDLRTSQGVETSLGLPPGPNSGLTVRRV